MHTLIHENIYIYIHIYVYVCMHIYVCNHAYMHMCMHACIHTCIRTYMHASIRTCPPYAYLDVTITVCYRSQYATDHSMLAITAWLIWCSKTPCVRRRFNLLTSPRRRSAQSPVAWMKLLVDQGEGKDLTVLPALFRGCPDAVWQEKFPQAPT